MPRFDVLPAIRIVAEKRPYASGALTQWPIHSDQELWKTGVQPAR